MKSSKMLVVILSEGLKIRTRILALLTAMSTPKLVLVLLFSVAIVSCGGGTSGGSGSGGGAGAGSGSGTGGGGVTPSYKVTVTKSSPIGGTVTSTPAGINCDTTCTTQTATFTGATSVALTVTPNSAVSAIFTGWNGGGCSGVNSCSLTISADTSATANFVALANNQLGLFMVTTGGSGTNYTGIYDSGGNPINISSTEFVFSEVIPATHQWVVLDRFTSVSYGAWKMQAFKQEDQAFEVLQTVPTPFQCNFTSRFNPHNSSLTSFRLLDNDLGDNSISGWEMNHVGIANANIYYKAPIEWNGFHMAYDLGGEYKMQPATGGNSTTLLGRTDPDNGAAIDVADHGTIYTVFHDSKNALLTVWTRDPATGKRAIQLRNYSVDEAHTKNWSFNVNNGILYGANQLSADGSTQIWSTDLSIPLDKQTVPTLLQTYPSSTGTFWQWGVDNGHAVVGFIPSGSNNQSLIGDLDTSTGSTQLYDFGSSTNILSFVPVWLSGSSSAGGSHALSRAPVETFGTVTTLTPGQ